MGQKYYTVTAILKSLDTTAQLPITDLAGLYRPWVPLVCVWRSGLLTLSRTLCRALWWGSLLYWPNHSCSRQAPGVEGKLEYIVLNSINIIVVIEIESRLFWSHNMPLSTENQNH